MTEEYFHDMLKHLQTIELESTPNPYMMTTQPELQLHMRPYLLDFLVETHLGLRLSRETLYLAINLMDRYCSKRIVFRRHYQLVGCTSLWIAAKYCDSKQRVPSIEELMLVCCNAYDVQMFVQMELHILSTLEWSVSHPTFDQYLDLFLYQTEPEDAKILRDIALYLCENGIYHSELLEFLPSAISQCALQLAGFFLYGGSLPEVSAVQDASCMNMLFTAAAQPTACLERKYMRPEFSGAVCYIQEYKQEEMRARAEANLRSPEAVVASSTTTTSAPPPPQPQAASPNASAAAIEDKEPTQLDYLSPPPTDEEDNQPTIATAMAHQQQQNYTYKMMTVQSMEAGDYAQLGDGADTEDEFDDETMTLSDVNYTPLRLVQSRVF